MMKSSKKLAPSKSAPGLRVAIVASRYNEALTDALLRHTLDTLAVAGAGKVRVVRVPGAYEIPTAAMALARLRKFDAIIALGVVMQGVTAHADHIGVACAINLQRISMETGVPVIHQVLSPPNARDAKARLRVRGIEAANAAIEMALVMKGF